jgi:hypothetical protein
MGWLSVLTSIFKYVPYVVHGIQTLHGDSQSGASKKQMAVDILGEATGAAVANLSPQNAELAKIASAIASVAIDQSVAIAKAQGTYQKATAIANAAATAGQILNTIAPSQTGPAPTTVGGTADTTAPATTTLPVPNAPLA